MKYKYLQSNLGDIVKIGSSLTLLKIKFTNPITKDGLITTYFKLLNKAYNGSFRLTKVNAVTDFMTTYGTCKNALRDLESVEFIERQDDGRYVITDLGKKYVESVNKKGFSKFKLYKGIKFTATVTVNPYLDSESLELSGDELQEFLRDNKDVPLGFIKVN